MTVQEILQNAQSIAGQFISNPVGIRLINNAVNLIANRFDTALNIERRAINVENKTYRLGEFMGIKRVLRNNLIYKNYRIQDDEIIFENDGEYEIHFYNVPMAVEDMNDEPDINEQYHPIIELYVVSRMSRPYDRELEQEFFMLAEQIHLRLSKKSLRNARIPARVWR